jgi:hypothetical protein
MKLCHEKWIKLKVMLSGISQSPKANITCSLSLVETRPKMMMMMMMMMGHECERGIVCGGNQWEREGRKDGILRHEED